MASAVGVIGGKGSSTWMNVKEKGNRKKMNKRVRICSSSYSSSVMDPYRTLRIQPNASESEIKKAFRQLALQYHPDVCGGNNCGVQFETINEAYDIVMSKMREGPNETEMCAYDEGFNESELWEEWMGWEGAGIRDYTSHINPYI